MRGLQPGLTYSLRVEGGADLAAYPPTVSIDVKQSDTRDIEFAVIPRPKGARVHVIVTPTQSAALALSAHPGTTFSARLESASNGAVIGNQRTGVSGLATFDGVIDGQYVATARVVGSTGHLEFVVSKVSVQIRGDKCSAAADVASGGGKDSAQCAEQVAVAHVEVDVHLQADSERLSDSSHLLGLLAVLFVGGLYAVKPELRPYYHNPKLVRCIGSSVQ